MSPVLAICMQSNYAQACLHMMQLKMIASAKCTLQLGLTSNKSLDVHHETAHVAHVFFASEFQSLCREPKPMHKLLVCYQCILLYSLTNRPS